jgi:hypothetical protein
MKINVPIQSQIKNNLIAIISVIIATLSLSYNSWRNERTEQNRTIRTAAFEMLKELDALQDTLNYSYFKHERMMGGAFSGWGKIAFINDLNQLLPQPAPNNAKALTAAWENNWEKIDKSESSADIISEQIDETRRCVLKVIHQLK